MGVIQKNAKRTLLIGLFFNLILINLVLFPSKYCTAADDFTLGTPVAGGSGCPAGTLVPELSADKKSVQFKLQPIKLEAGESVSIQRKNCQLAIPVHIAKGYQIKPLPLTARGSISLSQGSSFNIKLMSFYAGDRGPQISREFKGPQDQNFEISLPANGEKDSLWSPCGADTNFRLSLSALLQSQGAQSSAQIEKLGDLHFQIQRCGS